MLSDKRRAASLKPSDPIPFIHQIGAVGLMIGHGVVLWSLVMPSPNTQGLNPKRELHNG